MCVFLKLLINWNGHSQVICGSKGLHFNGLRLREWATDVDNSIDKLICRRPHDQWCLDTMYCITSSLSMLHCVGFTSIGIQFQSIFIYISICFTLQNEQKIKREPNIYNTHAYLSPLTVYMRAQPVNRILFFSSYFILFLSLSLGEKNTPFHIVLSLAFFFLSYFIQSWKFFVCDFANARHTWMLILSVKRKHDIDLLTHFFSVLWNVWRTKSG